MKKLMTEQPETFLDEDTYQWYTEINSLRRADNA